MVPPLYNLKEQGGTILRVLRKDLKQVAVVVVIYQYVEPFQGVYALGHSHFAVLQSFSDEGVVF